MLKRLVANGLWWAACLPDAMCWRVAQRNVADVQRKLLLGYLRQNRATAFGQRYDFASINSIAEYQARVPLMSYDDYAPDISAISAGQTNVLTREPVLLLEPTSGSTAATKLIPYTATLRNEFQRALAAWLADLYWHEPRLFGGQAYWSVSPVTQRNARTAGGVPIGFEDDSEYLSRWQRGLAQAVMAVPACVRLIEDIETFRYVTLLFLLRSRALTLISVWNPTFLTLLVARLPEWRAALIADLARGTLTPPQSLPTELFSQLRALLRADERRAQEVQTAFQTTKTSAELHARLWPRLRVLSCWADAQAAPYAADLAELFPQARVQAKGLLATEGFVSFPLWQHTGAALAYRSHFFEFIPTTGEAVPRLAHELEQGQSYSVVITTGGGLYRYQLHDLIEITGFVGACPLLRFRGKTTLVSDWYGEKLNEQHVAQALNELMTRLSLSSLLGRFTMLACETEASPPAYTLFIETDATDANDSLLETLGRELEIALQENFHYRYCRSLGQLGTLRVFRIRGNGAAAYLARCQAQGQRAGDIKPVLLHRRAGGRKFLRASL